MWLRRLHVTNLKRLRDFTLDLTRPDGSPRMWTVLIGRNGTGKTSLLQAAALTAAGTVGAEGLIGNMRESLPDKRLEVRRGQRTTTVSPTEATLSADFVFGPRGRNATREHPLKRPGDQFFYSEFDKMGEWLRSRLWVRAGSMVAGHADYVDDSAGSLEAPSERDRTRIPAALRTSDNDPLVNARQEEEERRDAWFAVGYGVQRDLPGPERDYDEGGMRQSVRRLRPLFSPQRLIGPNFHDLLGTTALSRAYASLLKKVLLQTESLVPGITDIELRGHGGVTKPSHLTESHRFEQTVKGKRLKLPARWLSHGYQSSLAWIADLVGQLVLEAGASIPPEKMEGLVLIDEIDLYLHPSWQVGLIQALRDTFPLLQFVATTHSPILLSAFRRDEVVMLDFDEAGNVIHVPTPRDPRLLTGSELYESFFGIDRLYPTDMGERLARYVRLATDPYRSDQEQQKAEVLLNELKADDLDPGVPLAPRLEKRRTG